MIVGILTIELALFDAQSLKDKRRVIQSLKKRLHNRFNVSVAEVAYGNDAKRCRLGIATVSNETRNVHSLLDKVVELVRHNGGVSLIDYNRELL